MQEIRFCYLYYNYILYYCFIITCAKSEKTAKYRVYPDSKSGDGAGG